MKNIPSQSRQVVKHIYKKGDLLFNKEEDGDWAKWDNIIIVDLERGYLENTYTFYTKDNTLERRTAQWVHRNFEKLKENEL